jgi:preprotein translocase subunit YajC
MNEVQLMIVSFLFILSIWFLIILLEAIRQEKRFKRMEENLERFKKSQEEERLTNKKVE